MNWEHKFLQRIQNYNTPFFIDKFMRMSSYITDNGIVFIFISLILIMTKKYKTIGYSCMLCLLINAFLCNIVLKPMFARMRPFNRYYDLNALLSKLPVDYSFPSGHTSASFAFATALFLYDKNLGIIAYSFATCVAMSRMYLMVHYPTDVLCGALFGTSVAIICNKIITF